MVDATKLEKELGLLFETSSDAVAMAQRGTHSLAQLAPSWLCSRQAGRTEYRAGSSCAFRSVGRTLELVAGVAAERAFDESLRIEDGKVQEGAHWRFDLLRYGLRPFGPIGFRLQLGLNRSSELDRG